MTSELKTSEFDNRSNFYFQDSETGRTLYDISRGGYGYINVTYGDYPEGVHLLDYEELKTWGTFNLSASDFEDLSVQALNHMVPSISNLVPGVSLVNFVAELRDIKQLFTLWSSDIDVLKNLSSNVLNVQLGWRPMLGDCEKLFKIFTSLQTKIDIWNAAAKSGEIWTRHADVTPSLEARLGQNLRQTTTSAHTNAILGGQRVLGTTAVGEGHLWCDQKITTDAHLKFHLMFRPKFHRDSDIEVKIADFYNALGFGNGASIIWEAVPLSFVVDWFVGVGDFLDQFQYRPLDLQYEIVDFGYSVKRTAVYATRPHFGFDGQNDLLMGPNGTITTQNRYYYRGKMQAPTHRIGEITLDPLLDWSLPTNGQTFIGLNLLNVFL
jgi:hypothetical protein